MESSPLLLNVINIFRNEMNEKYELDCLPSVYYKEGKLFLYDIATNVKELWESNKKIDVSFIECICLQIKIMDIMNLTFYAISMEDIYLLHYKKPIFIIINNHVINTKNDHFTLSLPPIFKKEYLHFPELKVAKIPATFHKSRIYYTIGLIIYSFFLETYPVWNVNEKQYYGDEKIEEDIEKIKGTKIYFFLKRCFHGELFYI